MKRTGAVRRRLAEQIYIRGGRITAVASVGSGPTRQSDEQPFYQDGRDLDEVLREAKAWQLERRAEMIKTGPRAASSNTLAGDVPVYLLAVPQGQPRKHAAAMLAHWVRAALPLSVRGRARGAFGDAARTTITKHDVKVTLTVWESAGVSPASLNKRLTALRGLFRHYAVEDQALVTDGIRLVKEPEAEARDIPVALVERILAAVCDRGAAAKGQKQGRSHSKIRLRVIAWTGIPHMGIERLRERDVDFKAQRVWLQPRRKGAGAPGVWLDLIPPAVEALRDYAREGLWEVGFFRSAMNGAWKTAIKRVTREAIAANDEALLEQLRALPVRCHPYDLRHAYASEAYRVSKDPLAVKELLQHANLKTTARYAKGAVPERAAAATAAMAQRWPTAAPRVVHRAG